MKKLISILIFFSYISVYAQESSVMLCKYHNTDGTVSRMNYPIPSRGVGVLFQHQIKNNYFIDIGVKLIAADFLISSDHKNIHYNAYRVPLNITKRFKNDFLFSEISVGPNLSINTNYQVTNVGESTNINIDGYSCFLGINYSVLLGMPLNNNYDLALGLHSSTDMLFVDFMSSDKFYDLYHRSIFFGLRRKL